MFNSRPQARALMEHAFYSRLQARLDQEEGKELAWDERIRSKARLVREEAEQLASHFLAEMRPLVLKEADKMVRRIWDDGICQEVLTLNLDKNLSSIIGVLALAKQSDSPFGVLRVVERLLLEEQDRKEVEI